MSGPFASALPARHEGEKGAWSSKSSRCESSPSRCWALHASQGSSAAGENAAWLDRSWRGNGGSWGSAALIACEQPTSESLTVSAATSVHTHGSDVDGDNGSLRENAPSAPSALFVLASSVPGRVSGPPLHAVGPHNDDGARWGV